MIRCVAAACHPPDFHPREPTAVTLDPVPLATYSGTYSYHGKYAFSIRAEHGPLAIVTPGQEPDRPYPASATEFVILSDDATDVFDNAKPNSADHISSTAI